MNRPSPAHGARTRKTAARALCLRVELADIEPAIWRRVWVDDRMTLAELHHVLQAAMGWTDAHLHEFQIGTAVYATPDEDDALHEREVADERTVTLGAVLMAHARFEYLYDFGDGWRHLISIERTRILRDEPAGCGLVEAGERACPPEDCGGPLAYQETLECIARDPTGHEAREFLQWAGSDFDAQLFDRRAANAALLRLAWNGWGRQ